MTQILTPLAVSHADVLRALRAQPGADHKAIAQHTGRLASNVKRDMPRLQEEGHVSEDNRLTTRGFDVLAALHRAELGGDPAAATSAAGASAPAETSSGIVDLAHPAIAPDPLNPRKHFDPDALAELAESIARDELLENLVVRAEEAGGVHRLVAGERRWRAIGLLIEDGRWPADRPIACKLVTIDDAAHRRIALVENLQRKDLRPIDEAMALKELMELEQLGTAEIAKDIGFTQRFVQQRLQLLKLPAIKQVELNEGRITVEDARRWLADQPTPLSARAQLALAEFWSVAAKGVGESYFPAAEVRAVTERIDNGPNGVRTKVTIDDPAIAELQKRQLVDRPARIYEEQVETGRHYLSTDYYSESAAKQVLPEAVDSKKRPALIARLRVEVLGEEAATALPEGVFATPWLNGPFETDPAVREEIERNRAARKVREADLKERQTKERETREAAERDGRARLAKVGEVEATLRTAAEVNAGALRGALISAADDFKMVLPLFMSPKGRVVDSAGREIFDMEWGLDFNGLAARRLVVAAVNAAAGLESPADEPAELDPDAPDRSDFLMMIAKCLMEGDDDITPEDAATKAERGLTAWLYDEGEIYASVHVDWSDGQAAEIAQAIRDEDLGQADSAEAA